MANLNKALAQQTQVCLILVTDATNFTLLCVTLLYITSLYFAFAFAPGDAKPSFGAAPALTPPVTKETSEPSSTGHIPPKTQHESQPLTSQPTQRLGALGSGLTFTPPPFSSDLNSTSNLPVPASTTPSNIASHPTQVNTDPSTTAGMVKIYSLKYFMFDESQQSASTTDKSLSSCSY